MQDQNQQQQTDANNLDPQGDQLPAPKPVAELTPSEYAKERLKVFGAHEATLI